MVDIIQFLQTRHKLKILDTRNHTCNEVLIGFKSALSGTILIYPLKEGSWHQESGRQKHGSFLYCCFQRYYTWWSRWSQFCNIFSRTFPYYGTNTRSYQKNFVWWRICTSQTTKGLGSTRTYTTIHHLFSIQIRKQLLSNGSKNPCKTKSPMTHFTNELETMSIILLASNHKPTHLPRNAVLSKPKTSSIQHTHTQTILLYPNHANAFNTVCCTICNDSNRWFILSIRFIDYSTSKQHRFMSTVPMLSTRYVTTCAMWIF